MDMSLDEIAAQSNANRRGGRRQGRSLKEYNGDVDMEANNGGRSPGRRGPRGQGENQRRGGSRGDAFGGQQVIVVNSMEEAQRLARSSGGRIMRADGGRVPNDQGRGFRGRQQEDVFRNFSNNRARRGPRAQQGVQVRIEGLDTQVLVDELSDLMAQAYPQAFLKAFLDYDETERSLGTGGIYFRTYEDAESAINYFNTKRLDGMPMNLYFPDPRQSQGGNRYDSRRQDGFRRPTRGIDGDRW